MGDLDPYPGNNTPPLTTPLIVKSPYLASLVRRVRAGILVRQVSSYSRSEAVTGVRRSRHYLALGAASLLAR